MKISRPYKTLFLVVIILVFIAGCKEGIEKNKELLDTKEDTEVSISDKKVERQKLSKEEQIASALFAAPKEFRAGAKVYGFDDDNKFITLREGTNEMICIADNPTKKGFEVVSYHKDLEPYMARGRALKTEGKSSSERSEIREREAIDGSLAMAKKSATLHILFGKDGYYDIANNAVKNAQYRYVVYIPFATQASTGLSLQPNSPGHPWLMFPGKANAHIMITPPITD